ncbi:transcription factor bHLH148-like [Vicia villosa]|uniref:transcription factor bHLH148-like n=1 Tax=Vicia villosa TaxID=3911 RepID=UPI00273B82AC|nr:transcription factor bHLH148-like [Vicia villosa]
MTSPSTTIPNILTNTNRNADTDTNTDTRGFSRKKTKNKKHHHQDSQIQINPKWKSQAQQQLYSTKLRRAITSLNSTTTPRRGKAVREAADRALAVTAKGRSRWSRAILMTRLKLKFRKNKNNKKKVHRVTALLPSARSKKSRVNVFRLKGKVVPGVQSKVRFLGRLVPGCKKEPLPVILEEAIDYIPALEMQVRAMSALFNLLSAASTSGAGGTSGSD